MRRLALSTLDQFDSGPHDLGNIGAFEDRHRYDAGNELREKRSLGEEKLQDLFAPAAAPAYQCLYAEQRRYLSADEEIEDEYQHQSREVADQLHVRPADHPQEQIAAGTEDSGDSPYNESYDGCAEAQLDRREQTLEQVVHLQTVSFRVP